MDPHPGVPVLLVGVDGSDTSMRAGAYAGGMALRLSARLVVATIESLVHRLIASPDPVDPQQLEDEIVLLLTGYLSGTRSFTAV